MGSKAGYSTIKDYLKDIRKKENIFVRIHTKPGEEAQVDFGYVGLVKGNNGKKRKIWVFNMKLSYSRLDYYESNRSGGKKPYAVRILGNREKLP